MKHDLPIAALVAYAAAKRNAALRAEAEHLSRQLPLHVLDIRECPDHREQSRFRAIEADD
jgi:hypothetical protein